jgi:DNA recombination protein RmuC
MTTDFATVFLGLVLLAAGLLGGFLLAARQRGGRSRESADPAMTLMQQQMTRLAEQVSELGSRVPKEVGDSLSRLMGQVGQRLSENSQTLQKATADTGRLIADIRGQLGELGKSSERILALGQDIRDLQQIFQAPKIRGGLGELTLESLLRQVFPEDHFSLQHRFRDAQTVDAALRLPGGLVPIDSKFPLTAFQELLNAVSDEEREKCRRAFARDVRRHIDDIADKYIRPSEGTLDFALMYIPAENLFYEVVVQDGAVSGEDDISAYARSRQVIPVSPNTLFGYLKAIAYGLMGLKIEERAREILKELQQLQGDFRIFEDALNLGQKHLKNAQGAFSEAGDRARRIALQVEQFGRIAADASPEKAASPSDTAASQPIPRDWA